METEIQNIVDQILGEPISESAVRLAKLSPQECVDRALERHIAANIQRMKRAISRLQKIAPCEANYRKVQAIAAPLTNYDFNSFWERKKIVVAALVEWADAREQVTGSRPDAKTVLSIVRY